MSRFSGRYPTPTVSAEEPEEKQITVQVRAHLTMNLWIESNQINVAQTILVTDSVQTDALTEKLIGVDGVTGKPVEVTIHLSE